MTVGDIAYAMLSGIQNIGRSSIKYEVYESNVPYDETNATAPEPQNMISIYTATKILSGALSRLDVKVLKEGEEYTKSKNYYKLKYRMNDVQNNQVFWSTLEYHRNTYGNAFVDLRGRKNTIIHPSIVTDYDFKGPGDTLRFRLSWSTETGLMRDRYMDTRNDEWVLDKDLLHFKGMSVDGAFGLPPVSAAAQAMNILDKASNTIISFYDNRALSPMSLESKIDTAAGAKATLEGLESFRKKYSGSYNAGKTMQLPPNTKLTPLAIQFRDAELVSTMKFTKDEIYTMYGIPTYMYSSSGDIQNDIEQQTLSFKAFTLAPIANVYEEELEYKLLTPAERKDGVHIQFDMDILLESDLKTKSLAYRNMVTAGIMTIDEAAKALGTSKVGGRAGGLHWTQAQYVALEDYEERRAAGEVVGMGTTKDDPMLKTAKPEEKTEKKVEPKEEEK